MWRLAALSSRRPTPLYLFQLHTEAINSLAVTEGFCITGSGDRRLRVWPLEFSEFFMEMELEGEHKVATFSGLKFCVSISTEGLNATRIRSVQV